MLPPFPDASSPAVVDLQSGNARATPPVPPRHAIQPLPALAAARSGIRPSASACTTRALSRRAESTPEPAAVPCFSERCPFQATIDVWPRTFIAPDPASGGMRLYYMSFTQKYGKEDLRDLLANMQIIPPDKFVTAAEYAARMTPGDAKALVQELVKLYATDQSRLAVFKVLYKTRNQIADQIKAA